MTDTLTKRDPFPVLAAVLLNAEPGSLWTVDSWHDEAHAAQLTGAEKKAAHDVAVERGYLRPLGDWFDGEFCPNVRPTRSPLGKRRPVQLFRRTSLPLPGQEGS